MPVKLSLLLAGLLLPLTLLGINASKLPSVEDQFGEAVAVGNSGSDVQVAILVSAKRLRRIKKWEKALRDRFPDLAIVRVADVPRNSPTEYEVVAEAFRKRLPPDLPVGIDLAGAWASELQIDPAVPNVLVFAGDGELEAVHSGMFSSELFAQAAADIDLLIKAGERSQETG